MKSRHVLFVLLLAAAAPLRAADVIKGQQIYRVHCANCHGADGKPVWPNAPDFRRGEGLLQGDPTLLQSLRMGRAAMPGFAGVLSERDLRDVIAYVRSLR